MSMSANSSPTNDRSGSGILDNFDFVGKAELVRITETKDFFLLLDEVEKDTLKEGKGFYHNRAVLLQFFVDKCLFGLYIPNDFYYELVVPKDEWNADPKKHEEFTSHEIWPKYKKNDKTGNDWSWRCWKREKILLPCLLTVHEKTTVDICWVASRCRRMGLGRKLVQLAGCTKARQIVDGAEGFFKKVLPRAPTAASSSSSSGEKATKNKETKKSAAPKGNATVAKTATVMKTANKKK